MKTSRKRNYTKKSNRKRKEAFFEKDQKNENTSDAFFKKNNIQPKLSIGKADDPFEKEADQMAKQVVEDQQSSTQLNKGQQVQKQESEEEEMQAKRKVQKKEEEEEVQAKRQIRKQEEEEEMQPKRKIQKQGGEEEEEMQAKRKVQLKEEEEEVQAKRQIQKMEEEEEAMQAKRKVQMKEEEEEVQAKPIRRKEKGEEAAFDTKAKEQVQKKDADTASPEIEKMLAQSKGKGQPLPEDVRKEMETSFETDFSKVMIHTGPEAVQMTQALNALAFTHGNDIYFNEGQFQPASSSGKELLAHELTHVVQQGD